MTFSSRLDWSARPNRIADALERARCDGRQILDLTESNPTHAGIEYPAGEIAGAFADPAILRYDPDPAGILRTREAVAEYHGGLVDARRILLTASTSEAYAFLFKLLCDPGDEVLVPRPSYPLFDYLARLESVTVRPYPLFYDHGWHIDLHALDHAADARARAVVLVNPNNPTGHFLKRNEWNALAEICGRRGLAVISDEVFADYAFAPDPDRVSFVADDSPVLSFSLSGLSKVAGLPQLKLGWIVAGGRSAVRDAAWTRLELVADTYLSVGTPVQVAAPALLRMRGAVQEKIRGRVGHNLAALREALAAEPRIDILRVEGGWYATLRVPRTISEEDLAVRCIEQAGVLVQPGYFYDFESEAFLIVSLLPRPDDFREGIARLLDVLHHAA